MPDNAGADLLARFDAIAAEESAATAPKGFMSHVQAPATPRQAPAPVAPSATEDLFARIAKQGYSVENKPIGPEEFGLPPRHMWSQMGQIGMAESFQREGLRQGVIERVPFTGSAVSAKRLWDVHQAALTLKGVAEGGYNIGELWRRYKAHPTLERDPIVQETAAALQVAMPFYYEAEMANERGVSVPTKVATMLADLLPFAAEFAVTGGLAAPARAGVKAAVGTAAKKVVGNVAGRALAGLSGAAVSAATRTVLSPGMFMKALVQRRMPTGFNITESGDLEISEPTEGAAMAVAKAFGDVFVEQFTEESGATLAKGAGMLLSPFARIPGATETANKLRGAIQNAWVAAVPGRTGRQFVKRALSKAGFDGILEEMGEERLGEAMRAAFNIPSVEAEDKRSMLKCYVDSLPSGEQLLVEALAFSIPGVARGGIGTALDARYNAKLRREVSADPVTLASRALLVARDSDNPALQRYGEKVLKQVMARERVDPGIAKRLTVEADKLMERAESETLKRAEAAPVAAEAEAGEEVPAPTPAAEAAPEQQQATIIPGEQQQATIVPAEAPAEAAPAPVAQEPAVATGISRGPVLDPLLARLSDRELDARREQAREELDAIERRYDEDLSLENNPTFKEKMAWAQDSWQAVEHEAYRRKQEAPSYEAATPAPVAQGEVQGQGRELSVPPTEQVAEPAPAAAQITIEMPREEGPAPVAGEAEVRVERLGDREFEASVRVSESRGAENPDYVGVSIQDAPNGRYTVRVQSVEGVADLHTLIASQLSEMTDAERIQTLRALEGEMGVEGVREIIKAFRAVAPRLANRSRVAETWGIQGPAPTPEAGGIAADQIKNLYDKYRKLIPKGVLINLLQDWVSWKQLNKGVVSPEVLLDWVKRHKPKPVRAAYIGALSKQLNDRQLRDHIDALKEKMDAPSAAVLAKAYRAALQARTPAQTVRVLEAVNLAVEKHNLAVAVYELRKAIKDIKEQGLLPEYEEKLKELLSDITERKPKPSKVQWAIGVLQAAEREGRYTGPLKSDIDAATATLQAWEKRDVTKLTVQEIKGLTKAVAVLANMDRLKKELLTTGRSRTFAEILSEAVGVVNARLGAKYAEKEGQRNVRRVMNRLLNLFTLAQLSHETMIHILGGNKSILYDVLMRRLREGENETVTAWTKTMDRFKAALAAEGLTIRDAEKWSDVVGKRGQGEEVRVNLESGKSAVLTVGEAMELLLHTWDQDTLEQLRTSKGIVMGDSATAYEVTGRDLELFDAQMREEHPEAYRLAKAMGDIINGELRYDLNKAWRKHHFYEVATKLDYWPRRRVKGEEDRDDPNEMMANWRKHFLDDMGIFQERTGSKEAVIVHDAFSTFLRHINRTSTYIGKAMPHADAVRLLRSPEFRNTVKANIKYGHEWLERMETAVGDWAGVDVQEREAYTGLVKRFIRGAHLGVLGLKPQIILYQGISAINVLNEMGAKYMFAEVNKDSTVRIRDEISKYAPVLWMRVTGSGHNIITPGAGDSGMNEMFGAKEGLLTRVGLGPLHWGDNQVMYRIWQAAKAEGAEKGLEGDALMRYVGERATEVVDRTQPTYDPLTISGLQNYARKNPLVALLLLYRSQSNKNVNMAVRAVADWYLGTDKRLGVMLGKVAMPIIGNALGVSLIAALYKMLKGEILAQAFGAPDDEDRAARAIKEVTWGTIERTLTQWMGAGDALNMLSLGARTAAEGKPVVLVPERQNVMVSAANDAVATVYYVTKALMDAEEEYKTGPRKYDAKAPASWVSAAERAARLVSVVGGIPVQELTSIGARMLREVE